MRIADCGLAGARPPRPACRRRGHGRLTSRHQHLPAFQRSLAIPAPATPHSTLRNPHFFPPPCFPRSEKLLVLQDRDQRIRACRAEERSLPGERQSLEARRTGTLAARDQVRAAVKENEAARRLLEIEAEQKRAQANRYRVQQMETRKNEEFKALAHEIEHCEQAALAIEDKIIEKMENAERLEAEAKTAEATYVETEKRSAAQLVDINAKAAALAARLSEFEAGRAALAAEIGDEDLVDLYSRTLVKKGDSAIVPLENEICSGCHMKVPGVTASDVKSGRTIVHCPNCSRILYRG